jgi:chromosome segregation ATPase
MADPRSLFAALRRLPGVVEDQRARIDELERQLIRLSPQVAALEERLETLRERVEGPGFTGTDAERDEARSLVEEVRAEHARVRARISAATVFEERLRVVEERTAPRG